MANPRHLDLIKNGVDEWNRWREKRHFEQIDLMYADLSRADLSQVNLSEVVLVDADLSGANLYNADMSYASLHGANLREANLSHATLYQTRLDGDDRDLGDVDLSGANLKGARLHLANMTRARLVNANLGEADLEETILSFADLCDADLNKANLNRVNLSEADLRGTNLSAAHLYYVNMNGTILRDADFSEARIERTSFDAVDLSQVKGLDTVKHVGPSTIGIDTIYYSQGNIPEIFLRGAGVPDSFIDYMHSLVGKPLDYYTCFISYSSKDQAFAKRLYADLQSNSVRCWFAPEDMKIGDKVRVRIDESIRLYDRLLLVLSEHSITSTWVEKEVETAFEKEQQGKHVLFPIRLDDIVMTTTQAWAADIRRTRHIGDFTKWKQYEYYQQALERWLRDLKANG